MLKLAPAWGCRNGLEVASAGGVTSSGAVAWTDAGQGDWLADAGADSDGITGVVGTEDGAGVDQGVETGWLGD